jgi:hypothetical protein
MSNITRHQGGGVARHAPQSQAFAEISDFAQTFAQSGLFNDVRDVAQACVKIQAGKEIGLQPVQSMTGINIIKGRITLSANLMAQLLKRAGYNYRVIWHPNDAQPTACEVRLWEPGAKWREVEPLGVVVFSMDDARKAGLTGGNWSKYARNMMFARAISNAARWHAPEVLCGAYTPDELGVSESLQDDWQPAPTPREMPAVDVVPKADDGSHPGELWKRESRRLRAIARDASVTNDELKAVVRFYGSDSSTKLPAELLRSIGDDIEHGPLDADIEFASHWSDQHKQGFVQAKDAAHLMSIPKSIWQSITMHRLVASVGGDAE